VPSFLVNVVVQARVILMLGAKDRRVPPPDGQQYAAALRAAGAGLLAEHVGYQHVCIAVVHHDVLD
jgi:predicted esterase